AETTLGGRPERAVRIETQAADPTLPQAIGGPGPGRDPFVVQVGDTAPEESEPETAPHGVDDQRSRWVLASESCPGNLLDLVFRGHTDEPAPLIGDPEAAVPVVADAVDVPAGNAAHGNE